MKYLINTINHALTESIVTDELKQFEVIPVYKKLDYLQKGNYNLLPRISKVCEALINKQYRKFIENKISECMTGFREIRGTQYSLIIMLGKWRKALNKKENISTIFLDLSKVFDSIGLGLLLAKLKVYGFSKQTLNLICSYLNRKQNVQVKNNFSLKKVITGVPKGSIDGQLLYNLHNLFFFLRFSTLNNYAGGKNLFSTGTGIRPIYKMFLFDFRTVNNKS